MRDGDTPGWIAAIFGSGWFWLPTPILVSFMFWVTGVNWIMDFSQATGSAGMVGLSPQWFWGAALILFYFGGLMAVAAASHLRRGLRP